MRSMRLDTLWKNLTLDEREDFAKRAGLQIGYLRLLGAGHKTGCSIATVMALLKGDRRLTPFEVMEEFSNPARDGRVGLKKHQRAPVAVERPVYVAPADMTDGATSASVSQLRLSAQAQLQYADALEAWNAARPTSPVYAEASGVVAGVVDEA